MSDYRVSPPYTGPDGIDYRDCSHCGKSYPYTLEYFTRNTSTSTPSSICRDCHRAAVRERYWSERGQKAPTASTRPDPPYQRDGQMWRVCSHCHEELPYDDLHFWRRVSYAEPGSVCWNCHKAATKRWHAASKNYNDEYNATRREQTQRARQTRTVRDYRTDCAYRVIKDPDEQAGFRPGALISLIEINCMLPGRIFTPGTELAYKGRRYVVEVALTPTGSTVQKLKELL